MFYYYYLVIGIINYKMTKTRNIYKGHLFKEHMKKGTKILALSILSIFAIGFLASFVSAVDTSQSFKPIVDMISGLVQNIFEAVKPAAALLVGDTGGNAGIFFGKFLLLLVLFALISSILAKSGVDFLQEGWAHWIISVGVAILGIYFLTPDLIRTIIISNSTLGVVLTAALPFIIYFYFVEKSLGSPKPAILRRVAWIAYGVVFLIIWIMTQENISNPLVTTIYPLVVILSLIMAAMDGTIQSFFNRARAGRAHAGSKARQASLVQDDLDLATEAFRRQGAVYSTRTPASTGETGAKAYKLDAKYFKDQIDTILNS